MEYYLQMPGDTEETAGFDSNLLGIDNGFGVFWGGQAMNILLKMTENNPDALMVVKIRTDIGGTYTITEFLKKIEPLKIRLK